LPKMLLFLVALAAIFLLFACTSSLEQEQGASSGSFDISSNSNDNPPQEPNEPSSSSVVAFSSSIAIISSSSAIGSSSSIAMISSSSIVGSSSSAKSSSSAAASSSSSATVASSGCSRAGLEAAVNSYLAALEAGNYNLMPLATNAKYIENDNSAKQTYSGGKMTYDKAVSFGEGLWKTPIKPDFHRNLIDVQECATFTEIIVANSSPQYVLGARLKVTEDKISEVSLVVTKDGDWGFNAKSYLSASSSKKEDTVWAAPGYIPREELRAAAYAYFAYFGDKTVEVPWGIPCTRVEGGMSTGDSPNSTCNVGVPDVNIDLAGITYLADVDYGMVVLFLYFGGADSHMFKILPSPTRYRYIHTLTAMKQSDYQAPR